MPRSEMTQAIERVQGMVAYVKDNLSLNEYELFLDMVAPLPEPEVAPVAKKKMRKRGGGSGASKSRRASGMAVAIGGSIQRSREAAVIGGFADDTDSLSIYDALCITCGLAPDANIHHLESTEGYHEFTPPVAATAVAGGSSE